MKTLFGLDFLGELFNQVNQSGTSVGLKMFQMLKMKDIYQLIDIVGGAGQLKQTINPINKRNVLHYLFRNRNLKHAEKIKLLTIVVKDI